MPAALQPPMHPTLPELARRFGNVPARRIRLDRYPADEGDVEDLHARSLGTTNPDRCER